MRKPKSSRSSPSQSGFLIVSTLVTLVIMGVASASLSIYLTNSLQQNRYRAAVDAAKIATMTLKGHVNNDTAWQATVRSPSNASAFQCLRSNTSCCGMTPRIFDVYGQDGQKYYDTSPNGKHGFTYSGSVCDDFVKQDQRTGNDSCPLQVVVTWRGVNSGNSPNCHDVEVSMTYNFNDAQKTQMNSNRPELDPVFIRGSSEGSLAAHCRALNGIFDQTRNFCILPGAGNVTTNSNEATCRAAGGIYSYTTNRCLIPADCPPNNYVIGFNSDGSKRCSTVPARNPVVCPPGYAIKTLVPNGSSTCEPYPIRQLSSGGCPEGYHLESDGKCWYDLRVCPDPFMFQYWKGSFWGPCEYPPPPPPSPTPIDGGGDGGDGSGDGSGDGDGGGGSGGGGGAGC
jgi:type II secretory pathway pseudopilin PulG